MSICSFLASKFATQSLLCGLSLFVKSLEQAHILHNFPQPYLYLASLAPSPLSCPSCLGLAAPPTSVDAQAAIRFPPIILHNKEPLYGKERYRKQRLGPCRLLLLVSFDGMLREITTVVGRVENFGSMLKSRADIYAWKGGIHCRWTTLDQNNSRFLGHLFGILFKIDMQDLDGNS